MARKWSKKSSRHWIDRLRKLLLLLSFIALAVGAFIYFGGLERVTKERVKTVLIENGAPPPLADCMAERMADRLSINQLRKLQKLRPDDGETAVPISGTQLLERVRRVDDKEAVEVTVQSAAVCAIGSIFE